MTRLFADPPYPWRSGNGPPAARSRGPLGTRWTASVRAAVNAVRRSSRAARLRAVAAELEPGRLAVGCGDATALLAELGRPDLGEPRLLGYYTPAGLEYALQRYGLFERLRHRGYDPLRVVVDRDPRGDRLLVLGASAREEHALVECVLERQRRADGDYLYVHWLTLRHPLARFDRRRPRLPGQDVPGLGLAGDVGELLEISAARLGLVGVRFRPAWFHLALAAGQRGMRFLDPARQGRFEAMLRDLSHLPWTAVSQAIADQRVSMNGSPYRWEAAPMGDDGGDRSAAALARTAQERERVRFALG